MVDVDKLRADFTAAVQRRNAGRAEVEAANEEIGKLFAKAIVGETGLVSTLSAEAKVSRTTAYAMAARPESATEEI